MPTVRPIKILVTEAQDAAARVREARRRLNEAKDEETARAADEDGQAAQHDLDRLNSEIFRRSGATVDTNGIIREGWVDDATAIDAKPFEDTTEEAMARQAQGGLTATLHLTDEQVVAAHRALIQKDYQELVEHTVEEEAHRPYAQLTDAQRRNAIREAALRRMGVKDLEDPRFSDDDIDTSDEERTEEIQEITHRFQVAAVLDKRIEDVRPSDEAEYQRQLDDSYIANQTGKNPDQVDKVERMRLLSEARNANYFARLEAAKHPKAPPPENERVDDTKAPDDAVAAAAAPTEAAPTTDGDTPATEHTDDEASSPTRTDGTVAPAPPPAPTRPTHPVGAGGAGGAGAGGGGTTLHDSSGVGNGDGAGHGGDVDEQIGVASFGGEADDATGTMVGNTVVQYFMRPDGSVYAQNADGTQRNMTDSEKSDLGVSGASDSPDPTRAPSPTNDGHDGTDSQNDGNSSDDDSEDDDESDSSDDTQDDTSTDDQSGSDEEQDDSDGDDSGADDSDTTPNPENDFGSDLGRAAFEQSPLGRAQGERERKHIADQKSGGVTDPAESDEGGHSGTPDDINAPGGDVDPFDGDFISAPNVEQLDVLRATGGGALGPRDSQGPAAPQPVGSPVGGVPPVVPGGGAAAVDLQFGAGAVTSAAAPVAAAALADAAATASVATSFGHGASGHEVTADTSFDAGFISDEDGGDGNNGKGGGDDADDGAASAHTTGVFGHHGTMAGTRFSHLDLDDIDLDTDDLDIGDLND